MKFKDIICFSLMVVAIIVLCNFSANAAIFDDQTTPVKVYSMVVDRTAMYSDFVTIPAGGTIEVVLPSYFSTKIISLQGTNTVSAHAFFIKEQATAGTLLITGTASDIISLTVWGKLD